MSTRPAAIGVALVFAAWLQAPAQAQLAPGVDACQELAALETTWLNFETQDVNASLRQVDQAVLQLAVALDQFGEQTLQLSPAAFEQLKLAHAAVEAALDAVPADATPEEVQNGIATAKDNERFAYQSLMGNIVCP